MIRFVIHWITIALALAGTAWLLPGVRVESWVALVVGALVLGLANAVVRPILGLLTLPITVLTLGLFYLVVNGASFALAAWIVPGFTIDGFGTAILGALICSLLSWVIGWFTGDGRQARRQRRAD